MRIDLSSNIDDALGMVRRLHPQFRAAQADALTRVAYQARDAMPAAARSQLDRPTMFTQQGFYTQRATKESLQAAVGVKDKQAEYLFWQVEGGSRAPKKKALRLPGEVDLNEFGNMPAGMVRALIARAKAGRKATKSQGKRFGVSSKVDLFYGQPDDGRPAGIYKRVQVSATEQHLVPLVVMPKRSAKYAKRFDFHGEARRVGLDAIEAAATEAWAKAVAASR